MSDVARLRADVELTRAELARTIEALHAKLDVKAVARQRAEQAGRRAAQKYAEVKAAAPLPVHRALDHVEVVAAPVAAKAAEDKRRTVMVVAGVFVAVLVVRRLRRA